MTTTEDAKCSLSVSKYPEVYQRGRQDFLKGLPNEAPYPQGSKQNNFKRVAWYTGWLDQWREGREAVYETLSKKAGKT